jgi:hypothetical protein
MAFSCTSEEKWADFSAHYDDKASLFQREVWRECKYFLLYYNRLLLYDFQCASAGGVAENGTAYKLACKGLFYFAEQQLCCLKGVASALDYETKKTIDS